MSEETPGPTLAAPFAVPDQVARWLWPAVIAIGGIGSYFVLFKRFVEELTPPADVFGGIEFTFLWETEPPAARAEVMAAVLNGLYAFAIPSVVLHLAGFAALVMALFVVLPAHGRPAVAIGLGGILIGAAVGLRDQFSQALRPALADCPPGGALESCPLDQALKRSGENGPVSETMLETLRLLVDVNASLTTAAAVAIGFCFFFLARSATTAELSPARLIRRRRMLNATITLAGIILVLAVAVTYAYHHLALGMMEDGSKSALSVIGAIGASYWGAVYTVELLVLAVPAIVSLARDGQRAAERALPDAEPAAQSEWCATHGLQMRLGERLRNILAALAPVLTVPALELLGAALA